MNSSAIDCYTRPPMAIEDGIPVFSTTDYYVKNYDRISGDHLKHFEATGHNPFMREDHWHELEISTAKLIEKYTNLSGAKILDVGVGMGHLLENFPELSRFGMDISRGYLRHAKAKGIEVCMSRIEEMPYKENYFDILVSTDVLEHVLDLNLALKNMLRVVKEGGIVVVRVPYREELGSYLHPDFPYDLVHLRNFDENSLRILFEKILNLQVLEWNLSGYRGSRLKVGGGCRYYAGGVRRVLNAIKRINDTVYEYINRILSQPTEINIVIKKSQYRPQ